jgi:alpha-D-ribose 1-methylphosphonate 5-triphosphate synthase subunit PhnI
VSGQNSAIDQARRAEYFDKMKFNDKDEQGLSFDIPTMYKVPYIKIDDHERSEQDRRAQGGVATAFLYGPGKPRKQLFIVSFKCSRVDVFFLLENTGLNIKEGDIVIVEADRGQDLGKYILQKPHFTRWMSLILPFRYGATRKRHSR